MISRSRVFVGICLAGEGADMVMAGYMIGDDRTGNMNQNMSGPL